jgi:hypothetical protein
MQENLLELVAGEPVSPADLLQCFGMKPGRTSGEVAQMLHETLSGVLTLLPNRGNVSPVPTPSVRRTQPRGRQTRARRQVCTGSASSSDRPPPADDRPRERSCEWCGEPFVPSRVDSRYCSRAHGNAAKQAGYRARLEADPDTALLRRHALAMQAIDDGADGGPRLLELVVWPPANAHEARELLGCREAA